VSVAGKTMQTSATLEDRRDGIRVVGAREHNLKDVSLSIPKSCGRGVPRHSPLPAPRSSSKARPKRSLLWPRASGTLSLGRRCNTAVGVLVGFSAPWRRYDQRTSAMAGVPPYARPLTN
jgi:hypothetical protein